MVFMPWYVITQETKKLSLVQFDNMTENVKYGVHIDFFHSLGIVLEIHTIEHGFDEKGTIHECQVYYLGESISDSMSFSEAREYLVKKGNEIINNG